MKQMPYLIHEEADYLAMQWEVRVALGELEVSQLLISVFGTERDEESTEAVMRRLHRDFPQAEILGCMAAEAVLEGVVACDGILVSFTAYEGAKVEIMALSSEDMSPGEMGKALLEKLEETEHPKAVGLLLSDVSLDMTAFLAEASKSDPAIKFFGGICDEGKLGAKGKIFLTDRQMTSGLALLIYSGEDLQVEIFSSFGWRPLGRVMTITKMETPYIIREIDRRPAAEVYAKYLDIHEGESFFWEALTFPICTHRDGELVARYPRSVRSDGALIFGADFRPGEKVRLTYGDPEGIIKHTQVLRQEINAFQPQSVFVVSCVARWLLLQHDVAFELEACRGRGGSYGYYAFGEFLRRGQEITLSNMNLAAVCMREGEVGEALAEEPLHLGHQPTSQTSIMRHLVYFINAMSYEVEATNVRLKSVARRDWLTDLMNRGELEKAVSKGLEYAQASGQQMAVMMVDIDDFKNIYDTYGYDVGDQALQQVAAVLRSQTRKVDSPGRWGGDVFTVIFIGMNMEKAYTIAERIREKVRQIEIIPGGDCLTVSLGLTVSSPEDDEAKLLKRADKALYIAKDRADKDGAAALDENGLRWHAPKEPAEKKPKGKAREESKEAEKKAPKGTRKKKAEEGEG